VPWTVEADLERCEGHALCVEEAPEHFDLVDEELVVTHPAVADDAVATVRSAVRVCPVAALRLVERT
jgi:ferredoxin